MNLIISILFAVYSADGTCGMTNIGAKTCLNSACSQYGYCGSGLEWTVKCQPKYSDVGFCGNVNPTPFPKGAWTCTPNSKETMHCTRTFNAPSLNKTSIDEQYGCGISLPSGSSIKSVLCTKDITSTEPYININTIVGVNMIAIAISKVNGMVYAVGDNSNVYASSISKNTWHQIGHASRDIATGAGNVCVISNDYSIWCNRMPDPTVAQLGWVFWDTQMPARNYKIHMYRPNGASKTGIFIVTTDYTVYGSFFDISLKATWMNLGSVAVHEFSVSDSYEWLLTGSNPAVL